MMNSWVAALATIGSLFLTASVFAETSRIEGDVTGADGRPLNNTQVRIQPQNKATAAVVVKTDAKGHFAAVGLPAGNYTISTAANGKNPAVAARATTRNNQTARVNLSASEAKTAAKKRWVWVPTSTGTHMGGHYEEVDASGHAGAQNIDTMSGASLGRMQNNAAPSRPGAR